MTSQKALPTQQEEYRQVQRELKLKSEEDKKQVFRNPGRVFPANIRESPFLFGDFSRQPLYTIRLVLARGSSHSHPVGEYILLLVSVKEGVVRIHQAGVILPTQRR